MYDAKYLQPEPSSVGLVAWWKLYEGTAFDYSLNGNDGTLVGTSLVYDYPGLNLAGSDEYIDTGNTFQAVWRSSFSISMWVKVDDGQPTSNNQYFFGSVNSGEDEIVVRLITTGAIILSIKSNNIAKSLISSVVFTNGQQNWHHIVAVAVADTSLHIYFDGVNKGSISISGITFNLWTSTKDIFVGGFNNNDSLFGPIAGLIDDVRIFNRAFSAADSLNIFQLQRHRHGV